MLSVENEQDLSRTLYWVSFDHTPNPNATPDLPDTLHNANVYKRSTCKSTLKPKGRTIIYLSMPEDTV